MSQSYNKDNKSKPEPRAKTLKVPTNVDPVNNSSQVKVNNTNLISGEYALLPNFLLPGKEQTLGFAVLHHPQGVTEHDPSEWVATSDSDVEFLVINGKEDERKLNEILKQEAEDFARNSNLIQFQDVDGKSRVCLHAYDTQEVLDSLRDPGHLADLKEKLDDSGTDMSAYIIEQLPELCRSLEPEGVANMALDIGVYINGLNKILAAAKKESPMHHKHLEAQKKWVLKKAKFERENRGFRAPKFKEPQPESQYRLKVDDVKHKAILHVESEKSQFIKMNRQSLILQIFQDLKMTPTTYRQGGRQKPIPAFKGLQIAEIQERIHNVIYGVTTQLDADRLSAENQNRLATLRCTGKDVAGVDFTPGPVIRNTNGTPYVKKKWNQEEHGEFQARLKKGEIHPAYAGDHNLQDRVHSDSGPAPAEENSSEGDTPSIIDLINIGVTASDKIAIAALVNANASREPKEFDTSKANKPFTPANAVPREIQNKTEELGLAEKVLQEPQFEWSPYDDNLKSSLVCVDEYGQHHHLFTIGFTSDVEEEQSIETIESSFKPFASDGRRLKTGFSLHPQALSLIDDKLVYKKNRKSNPTALSISFEVTDNFESALSELPEAYQQLWFHATAENVPFGRALQSYREIGFNLFSEETDSGKVNTQKSEWIRDNLYIG